MLPEVNTTMIETLLIWSSLSITYVLILSMDIWGSDHFAYTHILVHLHC